MHYTLDRPGGFPQLLSDEVEDTPPEMCVCIEADHPKGRGTDTRGKDETVGVPGGCHRPAAVRPPAGRFPLSGRF